MTLPEDYRKAQERYMEARRIERMGSSERDIARLNTEQRLLISEASFSGASAVVFKDHESLSYAEKEYFDNLLYGVEPMSPLWFELVQVSAEYAEWMKINKPEEATELHYEPDNLEWYGEFKRTRHEQMNIESYNEKDLV